MKQYTTQDQTAQLIELGFEKPKFSHRYWRDNELVINNNYSIGELIEMLPPIINGCEFDINHDYRFERWVCNFDPCQYYGVATELVDALYNLVVKLKEEEVI